MSEVPLYEDLSRSRRRVYEKPKPSKPSRTALSSDLRRCSAEGYLEGLRVYIYRERGRKREKESEREQACVCERERERERRNSPAQPGHLNTEQNGILCRRVSASTGGRRALASDLQDVPPFKILTHYKSHGIVEL